MRLSIICLLLLLPTSLRAEPFTGPWNLAELEKAPTVEWIDKTGPVRALYYSGEAYNGKPTRVFAYYAEPEKIDGKLPAMVLVHGGGGTAFREWAELWAKRGYVAIAMDLAGCGADRKPLPDGGPGQGDDTKFPEKKRDHKEMWTYHAVADVIRANSLLRSLPHVDPERIGITGISWGGYLTCIVAGLDQRFKVAVPVYGCGFLHENSTWLGRFAKLEPEWRKEWVANFDPSIYVGQATMPVLFVNGTNDFAYPMDSYQKTYRLVKNRSLCLTVNMPHGHPQGWAPKEIGIFVDSVVGKGTKLREIRGTPDVQIVNEMPFVVYGIAQNPAKPIVKSVQLHWTTDVKLPWQQRKWQTAGMMGMPGNATDFYSAKFPTDRPIVYFVTVTDERGAVVSTEHAILEK